MSVYTNTMRLTGLSGIDTESMVNQLMKAEGMKLDKLRQTNQKMVWQQEMYRSIATSMQTFSNTFLSLSSSVSLRLSGTFTGNASTVKLASGAASTAATVLSAANAQPGDYKLKINQLAQKESFTSASAKGGTLAGTADTTGKLRQGDSFNLSLDGKAQTITLDDMSSLNGQTGAGYDDALKTLLQNKVNTAFGSGKATVSVTDGKVSFSTNPGHNLKVNEGVRNTTVTGGNTLADILSAIPEGNEGSTFSLMVTDGTMALDANGNETGALAQKAVTFTLKKGMSEADALKSINDAFSKANISGGVRTAVDKTGKLTLSTGNGVASDIEIKNATANGNLATLGFADAGVTIEHTSVLKDLGMANNASTNMDMNRKLSELFPEAGSRIRFTINDVDFDFDLTEKDYTMKDLIDKVNGSTAGVTLGYDNISQTFRFEAKSSGAAYGIRFTGDTSFITDSLGMVLKAKDARYDKFHVNAQDAEIEIETNGIKTITTRDSNTIDINGLRVQLNETTDEALTISVTKDTSKALDAIKQFVKGYNELLDTINGMTNTNRPKQGSYNYYEPLTEDQRSAMKETDIANWEAKAKTGLLYSDPILSSITSSMRSMLYQEVKWGPGDDEKISLFEIGITTSNNYKDGGKLVIDEAKLTKALEERGADIDKLFTKSSNIAYKSGKDNTARMLDEGLGDRLNDIVNNAIGSRGSITEKAGLPGGGLSETTNAMYKQIKDQNAKIADMLEYLQRKENDYYLMFSKMEQAINQSNSQMSYLQAQLGQ